MKRKPTRNKKEVQMEASTALIPLDQVADVLLNGATLDMVTPEAAQDDMVKRILEASDLAEAFAEYNATPAEQIEGQLVDVTGIAWMQSSFDEGPAVYALMQVTGVESGEQMTVSMGGRSLMASFLWAQQNRAMPIRGTFRRQQSRSNTARAFWTFLLAGE
jgi:hypothetical protein